MSTDGIQEVATQEAKVGEAEPKKPPFRDDIEWLSDTLNIDVMYRVRGRPGLYMPITKPNKSGLIRMIRFMSDEGCWVSAKALEGLANAVIYKMDGSTIALLEAFDNLQEHFDNKPSGELMMGVKEDLMNAICPGYDSDLFKGYHAKKIINWYNEIVLAINTASESS